MNDINTGFSYENLLTEAGSALKGAAPLVGRIITATNPTPAPPAAGPDAPVSAPKPAAEVPVSVPPQAPGMSPLMIAATVAGVGLLAWYLTRKE